jgi:hypothetical protein
MAAEEAPQPTLYEDMDPMLTGEEENTAVCT